MSTIDINAALDAMWKAPLPGVEGIGRPVFLTTRQIDAIMTAILPPLLQAFGDGIVTDLDAMRDKAKRQRWMQRAYGVGRESGIDDAIKTVRHLTTPIFTPTTHQAGASAEDCAACAGTNPPYPFICPGDDRYRSEVSRG